MKNPFGLRVYSFLEINDFLSFLPMCTIGITLASLLIYLDLFAMGIRLGLAGIFLIAIPTGKGIAIIGFLFLRRSATNPAPSL